MVETVGFRAAVCMIMLSHSSSASSATTTAPLSRRRRNGRIGWMARSLPGTASPVLSRRGLPCPTGSIPSAKKKVRKKLCASSRNSKSRRASAGTTTRSGIFRVLYSCTRGSATSCMASGRTGAISSPSAMQTGIFQGSSASLLASNLWPISRKEVRAFLPALAPAALEDGVSCPRFR